MNTLIDRRSVLQASIARNPSTRSGETVFAAGIGLAQLADTIEDLDLFVTAIGHI
jgi:hypothetical protein